jgi:hypothetical protein
VRATDLAGNQTTDMSTPINVTNQILSGTWNYNLSGGNGTVTRNGTVKITVDSTNNVSAVANNTCGTTYTGKINNNYVTTEADLQCVDSEEYYQSKAFHCGGSSLINIIFTDVKHGSGTLNITSPVTQSANVIIFR